MPVGGQLRQLTNMELEFTEFPAGVQNTVSALENCLAGPQNLGSLFRS